MAKKKKTFADRVQDLEEREGILYVFIDDQRVLLIETRKSNEATRKSIEIGEKRIAENEEGLREMRNIAHALTVLHGESQRLIKESPSRLNA